MRKISAEKVALLFVAFSNLATATSHNAKNRSFKVRAIEKHSNQPVVSNKISASESDSEEMYEPVTTKKSRYRPYRIREIEGYSKRTKITENLPDSDTGSGPDSDPGSGSDSEDLYETIVTQKSKTGSDSEELYKPVTTQKSKQGSDSEELYEPVTTQKSKLRPYRIREIKRYPVQKNVAEKKTDSDSDSEYEDMYEKATSPKIKYRPYRIRAIEGYSAKRKIAGKSPDSGSDSEDLYHEGLCLTRTDDKIFEYDSTIRNPYLNVLRDEVATALSEVLISKGCQPVYSNTINEIFDSIPFAPKSILYLKWSLEVRGKIRNFMTDKSWEKTFKKTTTELKLLKINILLNLYCFLEKEEAAWTSEELCIDAMLKGPALEDMKSNDSFRKELKTLTPCNYKMKDGLKFVHFENKAGSMTQSVCEPVTFGCALTSIGDV